MFTKHENNLLIDLSPDVRDPQDWVLGPLRTFDFPVDVSALAIEPVSGILSVGTTGGIVYLFGSHSVEVKLSLPEPVGVRLLHFSMIPYNLVCLDDKSQLHIWDLMAFGRPKLLTSVRFDQTNYITVSPSHSHVFLVLQNGEIKTYDLACLRKSPFVMPNMWKFFEEKMAPSSKTLKHAPSQIGVEVLIHPRDLNLLFVAYTGGVVLIDLSTKMTLRAYELVIPPGAPGGAGFGVGDILSHRHPEVTALAVHPAGHFFAVGHSDGSIAFWAIDDDDRPLLVRTVHELDVNILDPDKLEQHMDSKSENAASQSIREPIFKLSWSGFSNSEDPRGGETILTVFGGLETSFGLSVLLLRAFNPSESPVLDGAPAHETLHPFMRSAMRDSLVSLKSYFYQVENVVQDYLLIPRKSPHFSGTYDPYAILMIMESPERTRTVRAFKFPPPGFIYMAEDGDLPNERLDGATVASIAVVQSTELSQKIGNVSQHLYLPFLLSAGDELVDGQLVKIDKEFYQALVNKSVIDETCLNLGGGVAWADETKINEIKLSKYQSHRILITHHRNLAIKFYDISAQLLINLKQQGPIENHFPRPLPDLTINLNSVLEDDIVSLKISSPNTTDGFQIDAFHLAIETLESAVVLRSGEVVVFRQALASGAYNPPDIPDTEIILLEHIPQQTQGRFAPYFLFAPDKGRVSDCTISDIGFLAVAYEDGSLFIVDLRGPRVILRPSSKLKKRHTIGLSSKLHLETNIDPITSLTWTISALENDSNLNIRLIAIYVSGNTIIYTIINSGSHPSWNVATESITIKTVTDPLPRGSFILDIKTGTRWRANRERLSKSLHTTPGGAVVTGGSHCVLVTVGDKSARSFVDINGERIGKVDWGHKTGNILGAQVVERMGSHALIIWTRQQALVYSLPYLEQLTSFPLLPSPSAKSLCMDESGDFLVWNSHKDTIINSAVYGTVFDIRRAYSPPDVDFAATKSVAPAQPQSVATGPSTILNSWFKFNQNLSGDQIDILLGGPDRPLHLKRPEVERNKSYDLHSTASAMASNVAASALAAQSSLYNRLTSAMGERGQLLGDLEDRFNSLEEGSKNMVAQAKRLATQQTAKSWFGL